MNILHSGDLHLREDNPRTIEGLEEILTTADRKGVDLVTLSGDLFESAEDADALRPRMRELLQDNPFDILSIPGNHDQDCYRDNIRYFPIGLSRVASL